MTDSDDEIGRIQRRTRRYWFEDGLAEIGVGLVFIILALYFLAQALAPTGSWIAPALSLLLPVLVLALALGVSRAVRAAKDRYVHPRTGYLSYPRPSPRRRVLTGAIAGGISFGLTMVLARLPEGAPLVPAGQGILLGVALLYIGMQVNLLRLPAQGMVLAVIGVALSWARVPEAAAAVVLFGAAGLSMAAFGAVGFVRYLHRTGGGEGEEA